MRVPVNPDPRPLPSGWNQHYDAQSSTWYYVCTSVKPPRVTTTHPLGPIVAPTPVLPITASPTHSPPIYASGVPESESPVNSTSSSSLYADEPRPRSPLQPRASGLTFAQQLYASAAQPRNSVSLPSSPVGSLPSPPLSPSSTAPPTTVPLLPNPPSSFTTSSSSTQESVPNPAELYHTPSQYSLPRNTPPRASYSSNFSSPSPFPNSIPPLTPHRTQSYRPAPPSSHQQSFNHHHVSTYRVEGVKSYEAPSLLTRLRPPPQSRFGIQSDSTPALQTAAALPEPSQTGLPSTNVAAPNALYPSPPNSNPSSTSTLNLAHHNTPITAHVPQSPATATTAPPSVQDVPQNDSTHSSHSTSLHLHMPKISEDAMKVGLEVGKKMGGFALSVAGGAIAASAGISEDVGSAIGGAIGGALIKGSSTDGDFMSSLVSGLARLAAQPGTGVNQSQVQAVMQGQPGADYQALINALMQQQAQPAPGINYQALILQLQQMQAIANAQQQAATQLPGIQSIYNVNAPATVPPHNPVVNAAYQNVYNAQAQAIANASQQLAAGGQQNQNLVQAAYLQQMQAQQQQQQQQQLQALQQMQMRLQAQQQVQAALAQPIPPLVIGAPELTPLGTFLNGAGQALASYAASNNSESTASSYNNPEPMDTYAQYLHSLREGS